MQAVQGQFAQKYNRSQNRSGAFWSDRFHATMIDSGEYLWRCMRYIDLNMVRAGVINHPSEWAWCGYPEIIGLRKRCRVLDFAALYNHTDQPGIGAISQWYRNWIDDASLTEARDRDEKWTERIAVGKRNFVERMGRQAEKRMNVKILDDGDGSWSVHERPPAYDPS
jgi:putative transposase